MRRVVPAALIAAIAGVWLHVCPCDAEDPA